MGKKCWRGLCNSARFCHSDVYRGPSRVSPPVASGMPFRHGSRKFTQTLHSVKLPLRNLGFTSSESLHVWSSVDNFTRLSQTGINARRANEQPRNLPAALYRHWAILITDLAAEQGFNMCNQTDKRVVELENRAALGEQPRSSRLPPLSHIRGNWLSI